MNPPLSPTARRWMLALALVGAALLAVFLWFAFGGHPTAAPSPEAAPAQLEPTPTHPKGPLLKRPRPAVAPTQVRPPPVANRPAIEVRSTPTQREQLGKPLEERLRLKRSLRPLVGWAKPSLDAGSGASGPGATR
jgi:hypothetical protein